MCVHRTFYGRQPCGIQAAGVSQQARLQPGDTAGTNGWTHSLSALTTTCQVCLRC
jgi:hypothetical protein